MKTLWMVLLAMALPLAKAAGIQKINEDENNTGKDDIIGISILYGVSLFEAIVNGKEVPMAPKELGGPVDSSTLVKTGKK